MKHLTSVSHIGYAVNDIQKTASHYVDAGWLLSEIYEEKVQNTKIAFLTKEGFPTIELVSPLDDTKSPVDGILSHSGVAPYHLCYEVDDIEQTVEDLYDEDFKPLFMPVKSVAMENRKICYLHHLEVGFIELVERSKNA
jgi:methylmalonyl-CoA/ethylmalonyl-CoA epimerase